ncbi:MAG: S1 family peptidase, partial [Ilumatobacteraceae bacterium]
DVSVVRVAAQPCRTPNRALGLGVVLDEDVVATAAHTVDDDLRSLTVDGAPATVLSIDLRTDLALLAAETADRAPADLTDPTPGPAATVVSPDGGLDVTILSTGPLIVHDVTDDVRHERQVHRFMPGVPAGTSGAPLVDEQQRVLGIVVLDDRMSDVGYSVTAAEVALVLAAPRDLQHPIGCPG